MTFLETFNQTSLSRSIFTGACWRCNFLTRVTLDLFLDLVVVVRFCTHRKALVYNLTQLEFGFCTYMLSIQVYRHSNSRLQCIPSGWQVALLLVLLLFFMFNLENCKIIRYESVSNITTGILLVVGFCSYWVHVCCTSAHAIEEKWRRFELNLG